MRYRFFGMSISLMFRAPLGRKASGALCGFRGQSFAQSKRYHTIEYKLILYAKFQLSNRRMVEGIRIKLCHSKMYTCAVYASVIYLL